MTKIKETSTNFANKKALADECPEIYASNLIGGQWSLAICCYLINGKMRFGELRKKLQNITERMLTLQLRRLEEEKIITRTVFAEVPPRVEYELTEIGYKLKPIILEFEKWGNEHKQLMKKAEQR
ncbi:MULTISPECIES: winged helix-turn-helix transcriptional regulator [Chryseobacterium]|jgi:DNA-binding HxlR family transcriptional regulator|uniref:Transcriptional regulator n=1 Tax=Chryseobacterium rhizosphaerae TaxID=395937 RepID=A0ABX9IJY9_9FLAO|nr:MULTISPECIES: helix-turn-helix domain-containing protein [Chryseobacterium]MDC8101241.1 helix-turn-helix transcriptional regulator [Chryseobacterium rhizosphaerae]MDR6545461.1 DNA-binding HxlR family transcriptional regulator [Chryseobacterium rhizosphaerae]REC75243.1 transcriptional regulator [Chryseobacterium rhizosphaerae]SMC68869.1 transcriptional regulator, HxlR family [Chryseobacterium sp. YR221]GEN69800.1 putative HTH-type transcriptional regulator YdeP [Chryseobacterium rhizosphaera